jgi:hypothetical protein
MIAQENDQLQSTTIPTDKSEDAQISIEKKVYIFLKFIFHFY